MRFIASVIILSGLNCSLLFGQLSPAQKASEFQYLAGLFAKQYGPYEWKRDVQGFDLLNTDPWLKKVAATKTDLEFYDVMSEYVSSLNDAHDAYLIPSNFTARLNFSVDLYDGALLVDSINRTRLPAAEFPFLVGHELVSIDGVSAGQVLEKFLRYEIAANPRSTRRFAASLVTIRPQQLIANAPETPAFSTVVFRRFDGSLATYQIPWTRSGLPLVGIGKYPEFPTTTSGNPEEFQETPDYMKVLEQLQNCRIPDRAVLGFGARDPIFAASLPNFSQRLGIFPSDPFFSGVIEYRGSRIGFIRIPDFAPANTTTSLNAFLREILYFQANTDGLVIDIMRNPGGSVSYTNQLLSLVIPYKWNVTAFEIRSTSQWVASISSSLESARAQGAPPAILDQLQAIKDAILTANREVRGRTTPIPLDGTTIDRDPLVDGAGNPIAYTKPLMVLIDETTASAGDIFAATIQDNDRGKLLGWRTMGAGGNVVSLNAGSYSLGSVSLTQSLMYRSKEIITPDFPPTRYVENVGVRPDIEADYMTGGNLVSNGLDFVAIFVEAMIRQIGAGK